MGVSDPEYDRAKRESRDCRFCDGNGLFIVFHPSHQGDRIGYLVMFDPEGETIRTSFAAEVSAHCSCPLGRWMRDRVDDELRLRIPYVGDILEGRSYWLLDDPNETDEAVKITPRQIREMIAAKHIPKPVRTTADQIARKLAERKESA